MSTPEVATTAGPAAPVTPNTKELRRLDYLITGWLTMLTMVSAMFVVLFLPFYIGTVPVPASALVGALVVYLTVRLVYRLTRSLRAAFAPAAGWLVVSGWLSLSTTFGYALVIGDWRAQLMLGLGALGAAVSLGTCYGWHLAAENVRGFTEVRDLGQG